MQLDLYQSILTPQYKTLQVAAPRRFSLVCFRLLSMQNDPELDNRLNHELLDAVNSSGELFISHTVCSKDKTFFCSSFLDFYPMLFEFDVKTARLGPLEQVRVALSSRGTAY